MTLQLIGTDALADNAVSTDKSQPFGNIILNSSAAGTDVGDRILLDRTNANGQDAGDAINVEKEILDIEGINVASRKQLKLGAVILESGTTDTVDGDVLLLDSTASGVDEGEMILYNETLNPATFNIGGTFSAGQAIKVNSVGSGFEFGAGGKVLQVVTVTKTDTFSSTSTSHVDITDLSLSITPSSTSSKIQIIAMLSCGATNTASCHFLIDRGGSPIIRGDAASNRPRSTTSVQSNASGQPMSATINTIDSPATTSSTTYKIQMRNSGGGTSYLNRCHNDNDSSTEAGRQASTFTLMEIGA